MAKHVKVPYTTGGRDKLPSGLYKIYWNSGGSSLASVGRDAAGEVWLCPCNWVSGLSFDWSAVKATRLIKS